MTGIVDTDTDTDGDAQPVDLAVMRETVEQLLNPDAQPDVMPPSAAELAALTMLLRGYLQLMVPEVARKAGRLPKASIPRYCAEACIGEARGKLRADPGPGLGGALAYARRLARVLGALCDHYEKTGGSPS